MIIKIAASLLSTGGMMWVVHIAEEHGDWKIFAAGTLFGLGAFLMGAVD